ncbi:MAG: hypothetical protein CMF43_04615 [Legionellales bacterium]|jgi:hypothetical protein|nr:hypothetical protein [Legionellales bacterium]|tara:strand:- start:600 stop:824 length:225 start_codon:yes stop_codon:yes gene_type:complete
MLQQITRLYKLWKNQKKHYQSPVQRLLDQWDKNHDLSPSQRQEARAARYIATLRDHAQKPKKRTDNWLDQDDIQ